MAINPDVRAPFHTLEYNRYAEIIDNTNFPKLSTTWQPPYGPPETQVFSKYALLTYDINSATRNIPNTQPFGDNAALDGFGKLRVTTPKTLFDAKQISGKLPQFFDEVINGSAQSVWLSGDSMTRMSTSATGDYVIRQTSLHFNYQPGKSMLVYFTGVIKPEANVIKRVGMFQGSSTAPYTPIDGIFIETKGGVDGYISFNVLKTQGTPYTLSAAQIDWNIDKLDGTGISGLTINFNYAQLMVLDYEWLGVGRIRLGFNIGGRTIYAHEFTHTSGLTSPYMTSSNQPVRYEIRQVGAGTGYLDHICTSVISEGGENYIGIPLTAELTTTGVTVNATTYSPVIAVRLSSLGHDLALVLKALHFLNIGNSDAIYRVYLNPTITGGSLSFGNVENSVVAQFANGSGSLTVSGGYSLASGYINKGNSSVAAGTGSAELLGELAILGTRINGDSDVFVIAVKGIGGTSSIYASVDMLLRS